MIIGDDIDATRDTASAGQLWKALEVRATSGSPPATALKFSRTSRRSDLVSIGRGMAAGGTELNWSSLDLHEIGSNVAPKRNISHHFSAKFAKYIINDCKETHR